MPFGQNDHQEDFRLPGYPHCPSCGGELEVAHRAGDGYAPECSYKFCLDCGWQGEPE